MKKLVAGILGVALLANLAGCGTILHPERKGQVSGKLDPSIVLLDAVGLLFFFVPGVVAFAVDFTNGTIYLPGGGSLVLNDQEMQSISNDGTLDRNSLQNLLKEKAAFDDTSVLQSLDMGALQFKRLDSKTEVLALLDRYQQRHYAAM